MKNCNFSAPESNILKVVTFLLLGTIIYSNTFHASFHFDDGYNIVNNSAIRHLWNLKDMWIFFPTRFLTYLSLAVNYHLHRLSLPGYHIFNLVVHLGAAISVSWFVLLLFSTQAIRNAAIARHANLISFLSGLIFVSHPVQTQAVTYIIQRTASMAAFFYLLSACLYVKSGVSREEDPKSAAWSRFYVGSIAAAAAALFTKETAATLPFMLLLCDFFFFSDIPKNRIKRVAPFFILLAGLLTTFLLTGWSRLATTRILKESQSGLTAISPGQYLLTQFRVIITYLRLLLIPVNQNLDYDYSIVRTLWQAPVWAGFLLLVLLLTFGIILFRKHRLLSFGLFWFFIALVPESSILPIRDVIFEHRLYLPMAGFALFLPSAVFYTVREKRLKQAVIILAALIACYSVMAYTRNRVWKDEITLWSDVVAKSPNKARPYLNRGLAYSVAGEYEKALVDSNRAIELSPDYSAAYCNRASVYYYMGRYKPAIVDYTRAIELNPDLSDAYFNRAFSYEKEKEYGLAISDWSRVIKKNPRDADAYFNRGRMYLETGEYDRAIDDFNMVIGKNPRFAEAYFSRGNAYRHKKIYPAALSDYSQALKINPLYGEAYNNRAAILILLGEHERAREDIRKMEELGYPFNPELLKFLPGAVYQEK